MDTAATFHLVFRRTQRSTFFSFLEKVDFFFSLNFGEMVEMKCADVSKQPSSPVNNIVQNFLQAVSISKHFMNNEKKSVLLVVLARDSLRYKYFRPNWSVAKDSSQPGSLQMDSIDFSLSSLQFALYHCGLIIVSASQVASVLRTPFLTVDSCGLQAQNHKWGWRQSEGAS